MPLRYVLFGEGALSERILHWLAARGTPPLKHFRQSLTAEDTDFLATTQLDFGLSVGYRHKLLPPTLAACGAGVVNLHWAFLPWNRGADPNVWAIVDGTPSGATLHWMDAGIDTGPIIAQIPVTTTFADTGETLYRRLQEASFDLFTREWAAMERRGSWPEGMPQVGTPTVHRRRDLLTLNDTPLDARTLNILRARTFPGYLGKEMVVDGRTYELTLTITDITAAKRMAAGLHDWVTGMAVTP